MLLYAWPGKPVPTNGKNEPNDRAILHAMSSLTATSKGAATREAILDRAYDIARFAGIDVVLSDDSRGFKATSTTGSDGVFRFARLGNGDYVATVGDAMRAVRVTAGTVQTLSFTVTGGANAKTLEQVVVTGPIGRANV